MRTTKITKALNYINLPKHTANHLIGNQHTQGHRMFIGAIVIIIGVVISKGSAHIGLSVMHYFGDAVGYLVHGIGTIPYIEALAGNHKENNN